MRKLFLVIFLMILVSFLFPFYLDSQTSTNFNTISPLHQEDISTNVSANQWPPESAEWYYETLPMGGLGGCLPCIISFQKLIISGDTLIQSKNCKVLQRLNSLNMCDNMGSTFEFIYESNDTIFWYNKLLGDFTILYNFTADVGDSWEIFVHNCSFIVNVSEKDSVLINDKYYNRLHIYDDNNYFTGSIIENIGHTTSFFPRNIFWECEELGCDSDFIDGLRCYLQNDTLIYKWKTEACDTSYDITGIEKTNTEGFNLHPNPTNNYLNISLPHNSFSNSNNLYYYLYNTKGQLVIKAKLANNTKIYIGNLIPGIYYFQLIDESSTILINNFKIIKL